MNITKNPTVRKYIYGIALAVLLFLAGEGIITQSQHQGISNIVSSVLEVSAAGAFGLAIRKVGNPEDSLVGVPEDYPDAQEESDDTYPFAPPVISEDQTV